MPNPASLIDIEGWPNVYGFCSLNQNLSGYIFKITITEFEFVKVICMNKINFVIYKQ